MTTFSNWCSTTWRDQEVRLTFTDRRQETDPAHGMAYGHPNHQVVAEIVMTAQDFDGFRRSLLMVPPQLQLEEPPPPAPAFDIDELVRRPNGDEGV